MRIVRRAERFGRHIRRCLLSPLDRWRERRLLDEAVKAIAAFPGTTPPRPHPLDRPLIVSLTSWPPRFAALVPTLKSLLAQTIRPDRTILWIAHGDLAALPAEVAALAAHGLELRGCDDLRSFKKLVPCLEAFPDAVIVTADDDSYYPPRWLETLVEAHDPAAPEVIGTRAHIARFDARGHALPYADWGFDTRATHATAPRTALFPTGVGGILYPPGALAPETLDRDAFMTLCPHADDIWFFWMARLQGTSHRRVAGRFDVVSWPASQQQALFLENTLNRRNDVQLRQVEARYGLLPPLASPAPGALRA